MAPANETAFSSSISNSPSAAVVCICFWLIRPAKSSSKKSRLCPKVYLCTRNRPRTESPGPKDSEFNPAWNRISAGLRTSINPTIPSKGQMNPSRKTSRPWVLIRSIITPTAQAAATSAKPINIETTPIITTALPAPANSHCPKAIKVFGGGPFAGSNGSKRFSKNFTHQPR